MPYYLGETQRRAMDRLSDHVGTITQECHVNTRTPVGQHFRSPGHTVADFQYIPIEKIPPGANAFVRKAREKHLINKYNLIEDGLNKKAVNGTLLNKLISCFKLKVSSGFHLCQSQPF